MKRYSLWLLLCFTMVTYAQPVIITLINKSNINIQAEFHFSDKTMTKKGISMLQSYQVVNFDTKFIEYVLFKSQDKDKHGNFYKELNQKFIIPAKNVSYVLTLETVPAHIVNKAVGTELFMMPESQKIVCNLDEKK